MANGYFGLDDEVLILESGVREIFTPHTPVDEISHFFGREDEASRLVSVINSPGQHILVYGDRGVGKTSLAKTTCNMLLHKMQKGHLFEKRCDSSDTFSTLFLEPLAEVGIDLSLKEQTLTQNSGGGAKLSVGLAKADLSTKNETKLTSVSTINPDSPSWVAKQLKQLKGTCLIDEADAIVCEIEKKKIAELVKLLSDYNSPFKLVIVGIAKTGEELTAGHPSVERCLKEVQLSRMSDDDLKKIILNGFKKVNLIVGDEVVTKIVDISAGFPHFTHLICLKSAERALVNKNRHITSEVLAIGLEEAVKDSEGILKRMYESTLRALNTPQEYKLLLLAASYCRVPEFRSSELRDELDNRFGVEVDSKALSRRLTNLTKGDSVTILSKPARGCFQFTDPRMPSFLKMAISQSQSEI
ncbi:nSTAND1 domain-containing NTPase [Vibrio splendidus]|uniref:nSTAND1 domain-containing NTPase n=1 Tax=Vibrio splendidus TaxID=29497 RepID=UPI0015E66DDF|nr:AAA family ATPase [Vibrio splendidus]